MVILEEMSIQGIRGFSPDAKDVQTFRFNTPLTLILGPNGTGKTSIIECLRYMATGETPPGTKGGNAFVHDPKIARSREVNAYVRLKFRDMNNKTCTVSRSLRAVQEEMKVKVTTVDGNIRRGLAEDAAVHTFSTCKEMNTQMKTLLGVSPAVLDNVIFSHQEESNWPLSEGRALKQKFDDIFDSTRNAMRLESIRKTRQEKTAAIDKSQNQLEHLKEYKEKAAQMRGELQGAESKWEESTRRLGEKRNRLAAITEALIPLKESAEQIADLTRNIENKQIECNQIDRQITDLRSNLKTELHVPISELRDLLAKSHETVQDNQNSLTQLEKRKRRLSTDEIAVSRKLNELMLNYGRQDQEAKQHKVNIESRDARVRQVGTELGTVGYESDLSDEQVIPFISTLKLNADGLLQEAKLRWKEYETRENELEKKIIRLRETKTRLESELKIKIQIMDKYQGDQQGIKEEFNRMESSSNECEEIKRKLGDPEGTLVDQEGSLDVDALTDEINKLTEKRMRLHERSRDLGLELQRVVIDHSARTQLKSHKQEKFEKERRILELREANDGKLHRFLGHIPKKNIGEYLKEYIRTERLEVDRMRKEIEQLKIDLAVLKSSEHHIREELKIKETEVIDGKAEVSSTCGDLDFDEEFQRLSTKKDSLLDKKTTLQASERMFREYISNLQGVNPPCPLCKRGFNGHKEVQDLVKDLTKQMSSILVMISELESKHSETTRNFERMLELKPTQNKITTWQQSAIPDLERKLSDMKSSMERTESDIQKKENELLAMNDSLEVAQGVHTDVALMDTFQTEIESIDIMIEKQAALIMGGDSDRTMQHVSQEKETIQCQLDSVDTDLAHKKATLDNHRKHISQLKMNLSTLTVQKVQIENDLQHQSDLNERWKQLNEQVESVEKEIKEARRSLSPLDERIENLETQKWNMKKEKNEKYEQDKEKADRVKAMADSIKSLHDEVERYNQEGKDDELCRTKRDLDSARDRFQKLQKESRSVQTSIEQIKEEFGRQEVRKRNIQDNLIMRTKEKEATDMSERIKENRKKLCDLKPEDLESERKLLYDEKERLNIEKNTLDGSVAALQDQVASQRRELQKPPYAKAEETYRNTMLAVETMEKECSDLDKEYEAVDSYLMRYHKEKMTELNKTIDERWRNMYKGQDIDTIKIQCDEEEGSGASKRRRSFNYRVQMVKGDTAIDMRGRCSAGQKVLASLIIRLALAETFSGNCPILALDDPTINMDRENMESLASSLVQIIKDQRTRRDFQLLVITHSEQFVRLLIRAECVDEFIKVSRSDGGYSCVKSAGLEDRCL